MASPRCGVGTRPTASCATGTAWCASEGVDGDALQETGERRRRLMASAARRALKLQVPWRRIPLPVHSARVTNAYSGAIDEMIGFESPHVWIDGNDVFVRNFFEENNQVPDVSRYRIESSSVLHHNKYRICDDRCIIPHRDVSGEELQLQLQLLQPQIRHIVLLLESPHRDEYQPGKINCPIAPASGITGHNIDRCLGTVLSEIRKSHHRAGPDEAELIELGCHVIISNPIQLQTSLHAIHGQSVQDSPWNTLRNNVWKTLWSDEDGHVKQCFLGRLNTYNPCLIINACTGDLTPCEFLNRTDGLTLSHGLKSLVTKFVRAELRTVPLYEAYHPADSSWKSCDGIHLQRIYPQPNITSVICRDVQRPGVPEVTTPPEPVTGAPPEP